MKTFGKETELLFQYVLLKLFEKDSQNPVMTIQDLEQF